MNSLPPELKRVLSKPRWTLDEAAWIFTGFSIDKGLMQPIRLADGEKIVFGSQDYRDALKQHDKILQSIIKSSYTFGRHLQSAMADGETDEKKATYKKNLLINLVTNNFNLHERVYVPWLDEAWNLGLISGYVVGKPKVVDSGKASATSSTTASAKAEVTSPKKLFKVKPLTNEIEDFRYWTYNKLVSLSLQGKPQPSAGDMVELIKECAEFISADKLEIKYFHSQKQEQVVWKIESLKKFIQYHTRE